MKSKVCLGYVLLCLFYQVSTNKGADIHDSNFEDRLMKLESSVGQLNKNEQELKGKVDSLEEQIKLLEMQDKQKVSQIQSLEETIKTMNETKEKFLGQDVLRTYHELWRMRETVDSEYEVDLNAEVQPSVLQKNITTLWQTVKSKQPFSFNDMDDNLKENDCCQNHTIDINIIKADIINIMGVVAHNAQTITENAHSINDNAHSINDNAHSIDNNTFYIVENQLQMQTDRKQTDNNTNNIDTNTHDINSNTNNIDTITNNIDTNTNNIETNTNNIDTNTNNIDTNTNNIETNTNNIETNTNNIYTNSHDINTNKNNINANTNNINTGDNMNSIDINTNKNNINTNSHDIDKNLNSINSNRHNIETFTNLQISSCGYRYVMYGTGKITYTKHVTDINSLNQGGLDIGTGVFTAPIQGTYLVTFHFSTWQAGDFKMYPFKNGRQIDEFEIRSTSQDNDRDSSAKGFTLQLQQNDELHVEVTVMEGDNTAYITFCTTLIK